MVELARSRAAAQGIDNVEFKQLQLEWIDLPTASVDAILCRWGVMLLVDPDAALLECRRVLAPGGRIALAVWDEPARNPWATIPSAALIALGHVEPPPPAGPGMFALAAPGALADRLGDTGFLEPVVEALELPRRFESVEEWLDVTGDISGVFSATWRRLMGDQRDELVADITRRAEPYTAPDGSVELPGSSLVAVADA
jgi:SAM-dependent methyltransferase